MTVSSAGGFFRGYGDFVYNASKAATTHMMKHMATALVPWDIRCNVIAPGCESFLSSCGCGKRDADARGTKLIISQGFLLELQQSW